MPGTGADSTGEVKQNPGADPGKTGASCCCCCVGRTKRLMLFGKDGVTPTETGASTGEPAPGSNRTAAKLWTGKRHNGHTPAFNEAAIAALEQRL